MGTRWDALRRWDHATAEKMWLFMGWVLLPIGCVFILFFTLQDVVPSVAAHLGKGVQGVFVVRSVDCGKSCTATGDFTSADGSIVRPNVVIDTTKQDFTVGQQIQARDTGDRAIVFDVQGGLDWLLTPAFVVAAVVGLGFWTRAVIRRFRPRRRRVA